MSAIIPAPQPDSYMAAIVKPFQLDVKSHLHFSHLNFKYACLQVWIYIILSLFAISFVSWILMLLIKYLMPETFERNNNSSLRFWTNFFYALEIIISQGMQKV